MKPAPSGNYWVEKRANRVIKNLATLSAREPGKKKGRYELPGKKDMPSISPFHGV